jgi:hypothetical protein
MVLSNERNRHKETSSLLVNKFFNCDLLHLI